MRNKSSKLLGKYERRLDPPSMRLVERDDQALEAVQKYDGLLARRHLKELIFPHASVQAMDRRISKLYHNWYLDWPNMEQRRTKAIPEPIVWLGWKGILRIAHQAQVEIDPPSSGNEAQLREFARQLREVGIRWQREPRWNQLAHDLAVIDFRRIVEKAVTLEPAIELETWIPEGEFLTDMDVVDFKYMDKNGRERRGRKGVRPDGYFSILDLNRLDKKSPARARFLLELDNATHVHTKFGRDKLTAGMAYIHSREYRARFGSNSGRWLIVSLSEKRMHNLRRLAETSIGENARYFYFATLDRLTPETLFSGPVWLLGRSPEPTSLLSVT
jgi:hypothetical protein